MTGRWIQAVSDKANYKNKKKREYTVRADLQEDKMPYFYHIKIMYSKKGSEKCLSEKDIFF